MTVDRETLVIGGGRNVFEDLGIPMSADDLLKADIAALISSLIQSRNLTQAEAAEVLGIDQPRVSKLLRGRLADFKIERLIQFVLRLGHNVDLTVSPTADDAPGRMKLVAAG
jgi:predicted XRE-type DNA-binding protein